MTKIAIALAAGTLFSFAAAALALAPAVAQNGWVDLQQATYGTSR